MKATGSWISNSSVTAYETCWGSPVITEEMIKGYKDAGFCVVRVPANRSNMMAEDYTLNADYVARIHLVDWILANDMYVILTGTFVSNGVPVIVGEYGCFGKNKTEDMKRSYMIYVCRETSERNMLSILWDTHNTFYNRYTCTYNDPLMLEQMMATEY